MLVKSDHFPRVSGWKFQKSLSCHHLGLTSRSPAIPTCHSPCPQAASWDLEGPPRGPPSPFSVSETPKGSTRWFLHPLQSPAGESGDVETSNDFTKTWGSIRDSLKTQESPKKVLKVVSKTQKIQETKWKLHPWKLGRLCARVISAQNSVFQKVHWKLNH